MSTPDLIARLQEIAARLALAPTTTEEAARRDLAARRERNPNDPTGYHAHQSGGLEQICRSTAGSIGTLIRQLQDGAS